MVFVESGVIEEETAFDLPGFADLVIVKCWVQAPNNLQLLGSVDAGGFNYVGVVTAFGGVAVDVAQTYYPCEIHLNAHVNRIRLLGFTTIATRLYWAYRYKLR